MDSQLTPPIGSSVRKRATATRQQRPSRINYPKKRASVACDVCRSRKTKCDAARPSCHFCRQLGIPCVYRRRSDTLSSLYSGTIREDGHRGLDCGVESTAAENYSSPETGSFAPSISPPQAIRETLEPRDRWQSQSGEHVDPFACPAAGESCPGISPLFGFRLDSLSRVIPGDTCVPELVSLETLDDNAELECELFGPATRASGLFDTSAGLHRQLDLSPRTCWNLEQAFSRDVLPWCPIIEQRQCSELVVRVAEHDFDSDQLETGMALLILSLGSFIRENGSLQKQGSSDIQTDEKLPGIDYYRASRRIINKHRECRSRYSIECLQCDLLIVFYLLFSLKPILAFEVLHATALRLLMLLQLHSQSPSSPLSSASAGNSSHSIPVHQEMLHRAYWTCYLLEHELQGHVSFSGRLLQGRRDFVPLPLSDYDEPGMYWFLSEITLRGICSSMPDGAVWADHMFDSPMLIQELSAQLLEWHAKLAPPIRFPLDDLDTAAMPGEGPLVLRPLLDPHKAFLRAQLYAVLATMHWPSVVRLITGHSDPSMDHARVRSAASASLCYGVLHVYAVEPLMQERHLMLFTNITGLYCVTMQLLCAYGLPQLSHVQHPRAQMAAACAVQSLRIWSREPNVLARVKRLESLMRAKGIPVSGDE